jgi:hypothetical protein
MRLPCAGKSGPATQGDRGGAALDEALTGRGEKDRTMPPPKKRERGRPTGAVRRLPLFSDVAGPSGNTLFEPTDPPFALVWVTPIFELRCPKRKIGRGANARDKINRHNTKQPNMNNKTALGINLAAAESNL